MKPFAQSPRCEKCGGTDTYRVWKAGRDEDCEPVPVEDCGSGEHHHVVCKGCLYEWAESLWPGEPKPKVEPTPYVPTPFTVAYVKPKCPHCGQEFHVDLPWPWTVTP
jgi:hypothetical protein